jgi:hypothetical protein
MVLPNWVNNLTPTIDCHMDSDKNDIRHFNHISDTDDTTGNTKTAVATGNYKNDHCHNNFGMDDNLNAETILVAIDNNQIQLPPPGSYDFIWNLDTGTDNGNNHNEVPESILEHVYKCYVAQVCETTTLCSKQRVIARRIFWQNLPPLLRSKPYYMELQRQVRAKIRRKCVYYIDYCCL